MRAVSLSSRLHRRPLTAVIALALAGAPFVGGPFATAHADTLPVTSCADDGTPGTLRSVIAASLDGDVVDMTQLTCGTITLGLGVIDVERSGDLTILGPGRDQLTISGGGVSPVFYFGFYVGTVAMHDVTIAHGHSGSNLFRKSACIGSVQAGVVLERVDVTDCRTGSGGGGAVYAGDLTMIDSSITDSSLDAGNGWTGNGGGAFASDAILIRSTISGNSTTGAQAGDETGGGGLWVNGDLIMVDSAITGNTCFATIPGQGTKGGGVYVNYNVTIIRSLIADNTADGSGGGLFSGGPSWKINGDFTIQDSTIANNSAGGSGGALYSRFPVTIANSTIADNYGAAGGAVRLNLYRRDFYGNYFVLGWPDFESTIIAGNTAGPGATYPVDLSTDAILTVFGAQDFIGDIDDDVVTLPPDTRRGDPMLQPLADNGGRLMTMAPQPNSLVKGNGFNPLGFNVDQRGPGFVRTYDSATDIGAYETQPPPAPGSRELPPPVKPVIAASHVPTLLPVTSCADDGSPGTLRAVAAEAQNGDTIDLTGLTCSTITLQQGPIDTSLLGPNPLGTVTVNGPGQDMLTISGNGVSAVFLLGGAGQYRYPGTITLSNLTIAHGAKYDTAACITGFSWHLVLDNVTVTDCHSRRLGGGIEGTSGGGGVSGPGVTLTNTTISDSSVTAVDRNVAAGGGLWAQSATLVDSIVSGNVASAPVANAELGYRTAGGGVYVTSRTYLTNSTIAGNSVAATEDGQSANGGGVSAFSWIVATGSTFSGNTADGVGGGVAAQLMFYGQQPALSGAINLYDTTLTGNTARFGAAVAAAASMTLYNSTVAFNTSTDGGALGFVDSFSSYPAYGLLTHSSIIASNATGPAPAHAADLAALPGINVIVIGDHNLIGAADPAIVLPPDTLQDNPLLQPLTWNGGPTETLALTQGSPAIDTGANPLGFATDQRGPGFSRVIGNAADIGAYEVQTLPDVIFVDGFDP